MSEKKKIDYEKGFREFVGYLEGLVDSEDKKALLIFRRYRGKEVGEATEMFRYIYPKIRYVKDERPYFLLASLFGSYPNARQTKANLGESLGKIKKESKSVERRFLALLNAREEVLHEHLRQIIALLKSKEVSINWVELLKGINFWTHPDRFIQKAWARSFYWTDDDN